MRAHHPPPTDDDLRRQLDRTERRARRYWFEDGLAEISGGLVFMLVGAYFLAQRLVESTSAGTPSRLQGLLVNLAFPALVVALALVGRRALRAAKDRYVHPRTGYVAFRRSPGHRWAAGALAALISGLLATLFTRAPLIQNWVPALEGVVFAVAFLYLGRKAGMLRFPLEGLACVAVGVVLSLLRLDENLTAAWFFGILGVLFAGGGCIAFAAYLRQAPPPEAS